MFAVEIYQQEMKVKVLLSILRSESGVTAIEYGLIASLIAVAAIAGFTATGTGLTNTFSAISSNL